MKFSFSFTGRDSIINAISGITEKARKPLIDVVSEGVLAIHAQARRSIQAHLSHGEKYGKHTASLPGFPPNTDTGFLVRSIEWEVDKEKLQGRVGTNLDYGYWLEFGTAETKPRPWLSPAYKNNLKFINHLFEEALRKVFK